MQPLRILTWHVHGSYLWYLAHSPHEFYLPVQPGQYLGRTAGYDWPANVHEIPAEEVSHARFDMILFQSHENWMQDQYEILSETQQRLPRIYLEHDPPRGHPTDTRHPVDDPAVLVVHVTHFNNLMWDCGRSPTQVIEHGVCVPETARYTGALERGLTVVNNIRPRGRRLGWDIFERAREEVPLDLVGMGWEQAEGLGEVPHARLPHFESRYRFFFNPIRYTSLGLSILEAMMVGLPVTGLATTELATVIENGVSGFVHTDPTQVIEAMRELLRDPRLARQWSEGARRTAMDRFNIDRFARDWNRTFAWVAGRRTRFAYAQEGISP